MAGETTILPLPGPITLLVRLGSGSVTAQARDDLTEARVRLTPREPSSAVLERVVVELRGSTLRVTGTRHGGMADLLGAWRRDRDAVDAVLDVPTGTPVSISTASADVTVTGECGTADVMTGTG